MAAASQTTRDPADAAAVARNPRLFILFRVFLNSRFYYPVYALMFLDFGLSQEQFATLNLVWAVSIVLLEVPSGALADQVGRRPLVIAAAALMIVEMLIMLLMPVVDREAHLGDPEGSGSAVTLLFTVFVINRIISGAAEAAASGADEALAYDSFPEENRAAHWSRLTKRLMAWQAISFIIVTLIGAALYDPEVVNWCLGTLGSELTVPQSFTLKIPIALTLGMAVVALGLALRMKEPPDFQPTTDQTFREALRASFTRVFRAGNWVLHTPAALMLLLVGLCFDSIVRLYYTVGSIWLEVIGYQPAHLGPISVIGSLAGILAAVIGEKLIHKRTPRFNFRFLTLLIFIGIFSLAFPIRYWSVLFLPTLWIAMRLLHYFLSNYLNRITDADHRATVLSFRGLSMTLAYGLLTWFYGLQTAFLRKQHSGELDPSGEPVASEGLPGDSRDPLSHLIFEEAVSWWWVYLVGLIAFLWLFRLIKIRKSWNELLPDERSS